MLCPVSDAWRTMELRGGEGSGAKTPPRPRGIPGAGGVSAERVGHAGLLFGVERVDQVTESLEERAGGLAELAGDLGRRWLPSHRGIDTADFVIAARPLFDLALYVVLLGVVVSVAVPLTS